MSRSWRRLCALLTIALVVALVGGCGGQQTPDTPEPAPDETVTPTPTPEPAETIDVKVYLTRGEYIGVGGRKVKDSDDPAEVAFATVDALLEGPTDEEIEFGLGTTIPEGTEVLGVDIEGGVATVDLSETYQSGGGSLSMLLRVAQMVCTLTQFEGVDAVAFKLDGEPVEWIGGEGVVVDPPVGRDDFEGQLPAILVETPVPGQVVASPITVAGSSNVFEAVHQLNMVDPEGLIVAEKTVQATSGTGTRGTWSETVEFENAHPGRLGSVIVFALSPKDGSQIDVVEIPVLMN